MDSNFDPATATDAALDRWIAERDGWLLVTFDGMFRMRHKDAVYESDYLYSTIEAAVKRYCPKYTRSIDAAVALAERWGYDWRRDRIGDGEFFVGVWRPFNGGFIARHCNESPEKPTSRALCEALAAAKAREEKP